MMIDTGSFGAQMTEQTENNIAAEPTEKHDESEPQDEGAQAPEFTADAPGFDMLADADADNEVENGVAPISGDDGSYKVLARKYRPRNFDDLIGQEAMVQTLTNAFDSGRIAHGFMLTGVRGVGKTTTARVLARALNYQTEAINAPSMALQEDGAHCEAIMDGSHVDVIEMDAASRTGIGDIREIIDNVRYTPSAARFKVYIIDEVHMLSKAAFNGLLKTLEEPPAHVKFIFATTEIRQVPVTVLSRCQRFDLRRLTLDDTQTLLNRTCKAENVSLPEEALKLIARAADGSARDALSLLDRALAHIDPAGDGAVDEATMRALLGLADRGRIFDLFDLVMAGSVSPALAEFEAQYVMGADPTVILADMAELTHWLTRLKFVPAAQEDIAFRRNCAVAAWKRQKNYRPAFCRGFGRFCWPARMKRRGPPMRVQRRKWCLSDWPIWPICRRPKSSSNNMTARHLLPFCVRHLPHRAAAPGDSCAASHDGGAPRASAQLETAPQAAMHSAPVLQNFQAVVALAADKRDIGLKHALENGVHLVAFESAAGMRAGRIELRLAEGQDNIAQDLTRKLREWTGQNWVVSLSQEGGAATLGSVKQSVADRREEAALKDPFVQAALSAFPKAEIVSISNFEAALPVDDGETPDMDSD